MGSDSLQQWLERLESLHPREIDLGLERISDVARRLALLPVAVPVITVAGTNGKGSTAATMEAVSVASGRLVGVCSSPHFLRFNERIRVAGKQVGDAQIVAAFEAIDAARNGISLTYFEFAALAALWVFRDLAVELVILEVGLGGRLDAINIVDADVSVITSIALDHQSWLGDTRDLIAKEKAGVFRPGQRAVIADPDPPDSLVEAARELGVEALYFGREFYLEERPDGWRGTLSSADGSPRLLPEMHHRAVLPVNICAGLQALLAAGEHFSDEQLSESLSRLRVPGRRESWRVAGRDYLLDVAHNPAAVNKLLEYIILTPCNGNTFALFSVMSDKDIPAMIEPCSDHFDAWFLADQPDNNRACDAASVAQLLRASGSRAITISRTIPRALRRAQSIMSDGDRLVVFGSFFTVAGVMPLLERDREKHEQ